MDTDATDVRGCMDMDAVETPRWGVSLVLRDRDMSTQFEKMFQTPGPHPNGLQASADGLWIIDQGDAQAYRVRLEDGEVLQTLQTGADRASGIACGDGYLWIASTYSGELLKVDPRDGSTVSMFCSPGGGDMVSNGCRASYGRRFP